MVDHYELTPIGRKHCEQYLAEMKAKKKEILDAIKDTCDETSIDYTPEELLDDLLDFGIDEEGEIYNGYGITDHYDMEYSLVLKLGIDFVAKEYNCQNCKNFYTCDNTGSYEECLSCNQKYYEA